MPPPRRVSWRQQAVDDMAAISRYVAAHSPISAHRLLDQIVDQVELLATYPLLGKIGLSPGTRELVVHKHYRVIYRALPTAISILRVKHVAKKRPP
jgi:plasmid stabilization system protein ParE